MAVSRTITTRVRLTGDAEYKAKMASINVELGKFAGWMSVAAGNLASKALHKTIEEIVKATKSAATGAIDFESALTGVAKTTTMNKTELDEFGRQLQNLSEEIPVTAVELASIAESAGQLGIADDDILNFTKVVSAMGVSTNMSSEEAATSFARMANIMHTSASEYSRMGSVVVKLGNNFATTESEIVDMAQVISSAGYLAGMSEADVYALATTLSSLGIDTAMGGSNVSKLMSQISVAVASGNEALTQFAGIAGMTAEDFSNAWKTDPADAILQFVTGLNNVSEAGGSVDSVLNDMGIKELRLSRLVKSLASGHEELARALEMGNDAWDQNTALMDEAGKFYDTTESQIGKTKNAVQNLLTALGDWALPGINNIAEGMADTIGDWREEIDGFDLEGEVSSAQERRKNAQQMLQDEAKSVSIWIERLDELSKKTELSESEQYEWIGTVKAIADTMPRLSGVFDTSTGEIIGGVDNLREAFENAQKDTNTGIVATYINETLSATQIAKEKNGEYEAELVRLNALRAEKQALLERNFPDYDYIMSPDMERNYALDEFWGLPYDPMDRFEEIFPDKDRGKISEYLKDYGQYSKEIDDLDAEIAELTEKVKDNNEKIRQYESSTRWESENIISAYEDAGIILTETENQMIDKVSSMQELAAATYAMWAEAYTQAMETVDKIFAGFGEKQMPTFEVGLEGYSENLQTQIEYMDTYTALLKEMEERGVSDDLLQLFAQNPSDENLEVMQGLAEATDEELADFEAKYAQVQASKEALATEMADVASDVQTTVDAIDAALQTMVDDADKSGEGYANAAATISSMVDGLDDYLPRLSGRVAEVQRLMRLAANAGELSSTGGGGGASKMSHAQGLSYVPYDGYLAELHKGEMVLVSAQAQLMRSQSRTESGLLGAASGSRASGGGNPVTVTGNTFVVRSDQDIRDIATEIAALTRRSQRSRGERYA